MAPLAAGGGTSVGARETERNISMVKRKQIEENYPDSELLFADGFDDAIIGVAQQFNTMSVAYNRDKCIEILMKDMDQLEAIEYFEFNVIGAYVGEHTPTFISMDEPEDFHTKMLEEKELLDISMKESIRQKEERTPSQDMQDKLEPIP